MTEDEKLEKELKRLATPPEPKRQLRKRKPTINMLYYNHYNHENDHYYEDGSYYKQENYYYPYENSYDNIQYL